MKFLRTGSVHAAVRIKLPGQSTSVNPADKGKTLKAMQFRSLCLYPVAECVWDRGGCWMDPVCPSVGLFLQCRTGAARAAGAVPQTSRRDKLIQRAPSSSQRHLATTGSKTKLCQSKSARLLVWPEIDQEIMLLFVICLKLVLHIYHVTNKRYYNFNDSVTWF